LVTPEKIEEWIQEVQQRPSSASTIIQYIANRLRELDDWNEKLRGENLDLRSGSRVDEYEREIKTLKYQLDLLKRQFNGGVDELGMEVTPVETEPEMKTMLVYGPNGGVTKVNVEKTGLEDGGIICRINNYPTIESEPPRLLVVPSTEELMFIFTSGRIITLPAASIKPIEDSSVGVDWGKAYIPAEPNVGETLACISPITRISLSDFYLQVSRRGFSKKIRVALASSIIDNKFIGTGVKVAADQVLNLYMGSTGERFVFVSYEGYLRYIPEELMPFAIVEAMRLGKSDHLVSVFTLAEDQSVLVMTQIGKVIHRSVESLDLAKELTRKGRMIYSTARREQGVRVIGASAAFEGDWGIALHQDGTVTCHPISDLIGIGSMPVNGELIDFTTFSNIEC
jgi:DNA gyrase/topoisomerase IV subunit A